MARDEISIYDAGDRSVGIDPLMILDAKLYPAFLDFLREQKTLGKFRQKLQDLVSEFMEAETSYENYMVEDDDCEEEL